MATKKPLHLAPNSELGRLALEYWAQTHDTEPMYMRLSGDGYINFGWRENLPEHTQQVHYVDVDGQRYDAGEYSVSLLHLFETMQRREADNG